jgi:hypothetical protein
MRVYLDIGTCGREKCLKKSEVLMLGRYSKVSPHCAVTVAVGKYEYLYSVHGCGVSNPRVGPKRRRAGKRSLLLTELRRRTLDRYHHSTAFEI